MEKVSFIIHNEYKHEENNRFLNVRLNGVDITSTELDKYITAVVLDLENICYGLSINSDPDRNLKIALFNRFLPVSLDGKTVEEFVDANTDPKFYSFLAEYLSSIVFRDVFNFKLTASVLSIDDTVFDTHTGVDACFYDSNKNKIVLGESKFYINIGNAINQIRSDLTSGEHYNKFASLYRKAYSNPDTASIIMQKLDIDDYEKITFEDFLKMDLIFTGFIMHEDRKSITPKELKDLCNFVADDITKHIHSFGFEIKNNYSLVVLNLPVKSKKELIVKIITKALELRESQ